ncbi:MAG: DNA photolyase family protein [Bacteroidales bacterium]|nr:DNA photolyase family protein [Bacteroidales bacterium]MCF8405092.1 DNA photolyase family protein [Bacteroidales bacterium]
MKRVFWFRRDLRLEDNTGLISALEGKFPVLPIFIFDENILAELPKDDARVNFIYDSLKEVNIRLKAKGTSILVFKGDPFKIWEQIIRQHSISSVFFNKDYEPYAVKRDEKITEFLTKQNIEVNTFKDQVIFEKNEVEKNDGSPYTVFTAYKNKWIEKYEALKKNNLKQANWQKFHPSSFDFPNLKDLGFIQSKIRVKPYNLSVLNDYTSLRNLPGVDKTSYLSPHLRFGTVSIREIIRNLGNNHEVFKSELIWREFFMQILYHFPKVINQNFRSKYNDVQWRNNEEEFELWCGGKTGYPLVDAGMRQLNETGYMHNRVRMVTAGFLCKHLLIDWRWGEAYFARKLLDYELSSNNGNWQWAAGTGCDAAPYFRIFNPTEQLKKFDPDLIYVKRWVPEYGTTKYPKPMAEHSYARNRALKVYKIGMEAK